MLLHPLRKRHPLSTGPVHAMYEYVHQHVYAMWWTFVYEYIRAIIAA